MQPCISSSLMVQNSAAREVERPKKTCSNIIFSSEVGGGKWGQGSRNRQLSHTTWIHGCWDCASESLQNMTRSHIWSHLGGVPRYGETHGPLYQKKRKWSGSCFWQCCGGLLNRAYHLVQGGGCEECCGPLTASKGPIIANVIVEA